MKITPPETRIERMYEKIVAAGKSAEDAWTRNMPGALTADEMQEAIAIEDELRRLRLRSHALKLTVTARRAPVAA